MKTGSGLQAPTGLQCRNRGDSVLTVLDAPGEGKPKTNPFLHLT